MPSPSSVWLVSSPLSHAADRDEMVDDIAGKLGASTSSSSGGGSSLNAAKSAVKRAASGPSGSITRVEWPDFKTGTLASLLTLADSLNKHDVSFQSTLDKIVDTIRALTVNDSDNATFTRHLLTEDGQPYLSPLTSDPESHPDETSQGWSWNRAKYRVEGRALGDIVDSLAKDMQSLDTIHKQKQTSYNLAKGQLATLQRKRTGNLATRDLSTVLTQDEIPQIGDSEYLQVVFVAVPKNNVKDFEAKYERLAGMVVPRSANKIAQDEEFALYSVTIFKRIRDDFTQKCREEKFLVREYNYDEAVIEKQKAELAELEASEKDLWTDLLRISRINFAEAFSLLIHLKVIASYVECVLRYGLPAEYFICSITPAAPDEKSAKKTLKILQDYFKDFTPDTSASHARLVGGDSQKNKKKKSSNNSSSLDEAALVGEFQNLMEEEVFRFVLQEIPTYTRTPEGR